MNFLKVAWSDISGIFKNRFIRVSVIAIIIVPILYSLLYLAAFWDPYSKLNKMPVAIVNEDIGSVKDGNKVNYGKDIVNNLKDNDKIGWRFIDRTLAENGVKGEKYYAMFVIPKEFSEEILSSTKGKAKQPTILYTANEKRNFLAAQVNGKVLGELKAEITKNISKEYSVTVFDNLYEIKDGMKKAADGSQKLADGLVTANDGTTKLKDGINTLNGKVPEMKDGVAKLVSGSNMLTSKLCELQNKVPKIEDGVTKLYDGSNQLKNGLGQLKGNVPVLAEGVQKLQGGSTQLKDGLVQLNNQVPTLSGGIQKLYDGFKNSMLPATAKLKDGSAQLATGLNAAKDGATQLTDAATKLNQGSTALIDGANKLNGGYKQMSSGVTALKDATAQVATGVDTLCVKSNEAQVALQGAVDSQLGAYLKAHPEAMKDANMQKFLGTLTAIKANTSDAKNVAMLKALQEGAHKTADGADKLSQGAVAFVAGSEKFAQSTTAYAMGAGQFAKGAGTFADKTGSAISGASQISGGLEQLYTAMNGEFGLGFALLNSKMPALTEGTSKLSQGSIVLAGGMEQLGAKLPTLSEGINKLSDGSVALVDGLSTLKQSIPVLKDGTTKLHDGSSQISTGLSTLNGKLPSLQDGVSKLYEGSSKLEDGTVKLADGSKELNDKLKEGYDKLNNNLKNNSETMSKVVSEPVTINEQPVNPVKNYGTGFTPYFIPLSLWVGAIMMFFVITDKVDDDINVSAPSLVAGKFLSFGYIGTLQAVCISIVVLMLGLKPANIPLYFATNIFLSFTFIAIIQSLIFLLGEVGRLLSIAILILQLTSCAGTFPLEVVPKFFKVANPFMPFTYAVSALREVVSGVDYSVYGKNISVLAGMLFGFLFISIIMKGHADKVQQKLQERKDKVSMTI